jgi:hypothetical protein
MAGTPSKLRTPCMSSIKQIAKLAKGWCIKTGRHECAADFLNPIECFGA